MKHTTLICAALACALAAPALGQNNDGGGSSTKDGGLYARASLGYAFAQAGTPMLKEQNIPSSGSDSYKFGRGSYGAGAQLMLAMGYKINRHLAAELGVTAQVAPRKYTADYITPNSNYSISARAKSSIYLVPALVISAGGDKLEPYMRMGLMLPVRSGLVTELEAPAATEVTEYKLRTGIGAQGALGLMYHAGSMDFFAELGGASLNRYLKSSEVTEFTINGKNELPSLDVADREAVYEFDYSDTYSADQPTKLDAVAVPFSNVQFNVGVKFNF